MNKEGEEKGRGERGGRWREVRWKEKRREERGDEEMARTGEGKGGVYVICGLNGETADEDEAEEVLEGTSGALVKRWNTFAIRRFEV